MIGLNLTAFDISVITMFNYECSKMYLRCLRSSGDFVVSYCSTMASVSSNVVDTQYINWIQSILRCTSDIGCDSAYRVLHWDDATYTTGDDVLIMDNYLKVKLTHIIMYKGRIYCIVRPYSRVTNGHEARACMPLYRVYEPNKIDSKITAIHKLPKDIMYSPGDIVQCLELDIYANHSLWRTCKVLNNKNQCLSVSPINGSQDNKIIRAIPEMTRFVARPSCLERSLPGMFRSIYRGICRYMCFIAI